MIVEVVVMALDVLKVVQDVEEHGLRGKIATMNVYINALVLVIARAKTVLGLVRIVTVQEDALADVLPRVLWNV